MEQERYQGGNPVLPQTSWKTIGKSWKASVSLSTSVTLDWMIWKSCHSPRFCMAVKIPMSEILKNRYALPNLDEICQVWCFPSPQ